MNDLGVAYTFIFCNCLHNEEVVAMTKAITVLRSWWLKEKQVSHSVKASLLVTTVLLYKVEHFVEHP